SSLIPSSYPGQRTKSVLILSCNYGGGHRSAAGALREWWQTHRPDWNIQVEDYFSRFVHPLYARATEFGYTQSVRLFPPVYRFFYDLTANMPSESKTQQWINQLGQQALARCLREDNTDLVVAVHSTP